MLLVGRDNNCPNTKAQFHKACKHKKYAQHEISSLITNRITNQISICCILLVTDNQLLLAYPENQVNIWLVTLFLLRNKFHATQMFVLTGFMKLGPGNQVYPCNHFNLTHTLLITCIIHTSRLQLTNQFW